jgi:hypothetical protein
MIGRRLWLWTLVAGLLLLLLIGLDLWRFGGAFRDWVKPERSLAFFGFVAGALVVAWQLSRQHQNALSAQALQARNALNLEIYKDLATVEERAADSSRELLTGVMAIQLDLHTRRTIFRANGRIPPASESHHDFLQRVGKATSDALSVTTVLEKWEIALNPETQRRLKLALFGHVETARTAAFDFGTAVAGLIQGPEIGPVGWPPSDETLEMVTQKGARVQEAVFDLVADLYDLRVETQNALLGGLFPNRLKPRDPTEPTAKPITVDAGGKPRWPPPSTPAS